ncbi:NAD(P)/FAD-dependent oxidoreductase [Streptomyces sp. NPDC006879]|uniref:NAD(P)/FAD-dependent oxidoreductase n=1 Tax=Streptomyces sp. NPDC006879 TaxID=3364767 RepID=UPI00369A4C56
MRKTLVVVGYGMVGHRLVEEIRAGDTSGHWRVVVAAEEPRPAYDRVALSSYVAGTSVAELTLPSRTATSQDRPGPEVRLSTPAVHLDRAARAVTLVDGTRLSYDALVLATGSRPFVPPVPGRELPGCFTYRTVEDLDAIREAARAGAPGVVIGGGLLGLEAAQALRTLGMRARVVELAPHLMPLQIDAGAGRVLAGLVAGLGVEAYCGRSLAAVLPDAEGRVRGVRLSDGSFVEARMVIFSAGVRPRDELAEPAGLARGERGGFLVDSHCRTADARVWAVGECAAVEGRCHGMAAPGYRMAEIVARQLLGAPAEPFPGADTSARLKLLGVEVAGFGDVHGSGEGVLSFVRVDPRAGTYAKLVLDADGRTLRGGVLAGDARGYPGLRALLGHPLTSPPERLLAP